MVNVKLRHIGGCRGTAEIGNRDMIRIQYVAAAVAALALSATTASALTITNQVGNALPTGFTLITDFNSIGPFTRISDSKGGTINDLAPGFTFTQDVQQAYTRDGGAGLDSGKSAPPPLNNGVAGDFYETVENGGKATLTSLKGLKKFSFYMGSPDSRSPGGIGFNNTLNFKFYTASGDISLAGVNIWGGPGVQVGNGAQTFGTTVTYDFGSDDVSKIEFSSGGNSFEFDKLAGVAVPEPATWAMMIMGFGAAGVMLRRRRSAVA